MTYLEYEYELCRRRRQRSRMERMRRIALRWKLASVLLLAALLVAACEAQKASATQDSHPVPAAAELPAQAAPVAAAAEEPTEEDLPIYHLEAISFYAVPLDHDLQAHIIRTSQQYGVDPALVMAVIEKESTFNPEAVGDSGNSEGLMQIQRRWHQERMDRLGADDLLNPYQNTSVGIDYLAELLGRWGDTHKALMAYNMGESKAISLWSTGIATSQYSCAVVSNMEGLK